jgi:hypothetical protein
MNVRRVISAFWIGWHDSPHQVWVQLVNGKGQPIIPNDTRLKVHTCFWWILINGQPGNYLPGFSHWRSILLTTIETRIV